MVKNKILIYTCITGGYDTPTDNFPKKPGYDYILISDQYIKTHSWKCLIPKFENMDHLDNTKKQRYIKTHPHELFPEYNVVIWIDAHPRHKHIYRRTECGHRRRYYGLWKYGCSKYGARICSPTIYDRPWKYGTRKYGT